MEFLRVWLNGLKRMVVGEFERENERLEAAKQSSTKLRAIKSLDLPPADEDSSHVDVLDKSRGVTPMYSSRKEITHHRLEALSARFAEQ